MRTLHSTFAAFTFDQRRAIASARTPRPGKQRFAHTFFAFILLLSPILLLTHLRKFSVYVVLLLLLFFVFSFFLFWPFY